MKKYFFSMVVMAIFAIGFTASGDESSGSETQTEQNSEKQKNDDALMKDGYDRGYRHAMQFSEYDEGVLRTQYVSLYGAPQSDDEINTYKRYKQQYDKGWEKGKEAKRKMDNM